MLTAYRRAERDRCSLSPSYYPTGRCVETLYRLDLNIDLYALYTIRLASSPMTCRTLSIPLLLLSVLASLAPAQPTKVTINGDNTEIDGKKIFGISVAVLPPPDGKTPEGKSAWQEF